MGLLGWLFGPMELPRQAGARRKKKAIKAGPARERREQMEQRAREKAERERGVIQQMDRSYAAGYLVNPLSSAQRSALPATAFAVPDGRKLPLDTPRRVKGAVSRFASTQFRSLKEARAAAGRILEAAVRHGVPVGPNTMVAELAGAYTERVPARRRNLDAFTDGAGVIHPMRGTAGYDPIAAGDDVYLVEPGLHPDRRIRSLSGRIREKEYWLVDKKTDPAGRKLGPATLARGKRQMTALRVKLGKMVRAHERKERDERAEHERRMRKAAEEWSAASRREWKREVKAAVRAVSPRGIAPHRDRELTYEYRHGVPLHLRNRRSLPADEVAHLLGMEYPHLGIRSEDDLIQALRW